MKITEDYVSFEVANLLKEKEFNWDCITYYVDSEPDDVKYSMLFENNTTWEEHWCSAPTHQMAMKWLREEFDLNIEIDTIGLKDRGTLRWRSTIYNLNNQLECYYDENCSSYEEAVEVALKYVLENLI